MNWKDSLEEKLKNNILYRVDCDFGFLLLLLIFSIFPTCFYFLEGTLFIDTFPSVFITLLFFLYLLFFIVSLAIFIDNLCLRIKSRDIKKHLLLVKAHQQHVSIFPYLGIMILLLLPTLTTENISFLIFLYILLDSLLLFFLLKEDIQYSTLRNAIHELSTGNISYKIEETKDNNVQVIQELNHLSDGLIIAMEEQLKSERLKTDLITNVSHDLRTPLTSIINYIGLLQKQKPKDKKTRQYLKVLETKAEKLKNLTDDLIEVSKVTSGSEPLTLEHVNFSEIVLQANGEFAEKLEEKHLEIISSIDNSSIFLTIDPKKMWRVIENIYMNVYKYALEHTRVYIDLKQKEDSILFTIKNISKQKLNISPDELTERFVRGDSSRNTTGNGLGLAISKSLVELHGGSFNITIYGDLFMVEIALPSSLL